MLAFTLLPIRSNVKANMDNIIVIIVFFLCAIGYRVKYLKKQVFLIVLI